MMLIIPQGPGVPSCFYFYHKVFLCHLGVSVCIKGSDFSVVLFSGICKQEEENLHYKNCHYYIIMRKVLELNVGGIDMEVFLKLITYQTKKLISILQLCIY